MIEAGEIVLFSSDGIAEAHSPDGEMFGCPRIIDVVTHHATTEDLRDEVLDSLHAFTGADWDQEDDITMVVLDRLPYEAADFTPTDGERLATFEIASEPGNERAAMQRVVEVVEPLGLPATKLDKLKTAVAEATMNAIEHGNHNDPDLPVGVEVSKRGEELHVRITDHGGGAQIPEETAPDIDAKLRGEQTPRGWGLFLIKNMVDDMIVTSDDVHHTVELVVRLGEES
jgi:anti-sigma regulatory factor (Ser/Thr protein kinase)